MVAIVGFAVAETLLGIMRTYLFAHTTNRVDVELGARLFRHLMALPLSYFQSRRVGDSVARVRELENIRVFLTSSALTLVLDLFFTLVFVGGDVLLLAAAQLDRASRPFPSTSGSRSAWRRCSAAGSTRSSGAARRTRRSWSRTSPASRPSRRWRPSRRCSGAGRTSSPATSRPASACSASATRRAKSVQLITKLVNAAVLFFGAKLVIEGSLTIGELVAFNMIAGRVSAPVLRLAQIWQDFHQARLSVERLGDILNTPTGAGLRAGPRGAAGARRQHRLRPCQLPLPARRPACAAGRELQSAGRPGRRHRRPLRFGQEHDRQADPAPLRARKRTRAGRRHRPRAWPTRHGCAGRSASCCRRTCCSTARSATTSRSPIPAMPLARVVARGQARRRARLHPATCRKATTPWSASAAAACRAGSASASPSPAPWSAIRAS